MGMKFQLEMEPVSLDNHLELDYDIPECVIWVE